MARDRVQTLVNLTYEKIHELEDLLSQESKLVGYDVSAQLNTVLTRQKEVVDRALRSIGNVRQQQQHPRSQPSSSTSRAFSTSSSFSKGAAERSDGKEAKAHELANNKFEGKETSAKARHLVSDQTDGAKQERQAKSEISWYGSGSLDRSFVKRKKGGGTTLEKSRAYRKTVASLAGLDQADELQPDEKYKLGLPSLSSNADHRLSKLMLEQKRQALTARLHELSNPKPGPTGEQTAHFGAKSTNTNFTRFCSTPILTVLPLPTNFPARPPKHQVHSSQVLCDPLSSESKSSKSKAWFETNLDDSAALPLTLSRINLKVSRDSSPVLEPGDSTNTKVTVPILSPRTDISEKSSRSSESSESRLNFLNESTKPFEMSDYYKYSTKFHKQERARDSNQEQKKPKSSSIHSTLEKQVAGKSRSEMFDANGNPSRTNVIKSTSFQDNMTPLTPNTTEVRGTQLYQNILTDAKIDPLDDDLEWVMDSLETPTFV